MHSSWQTPLTLGACVLPAPALGSPGASVPPPAHPTHPAHPSHPSHPSHPAHPSHPSHPAPCSTLFVANLGQFVSEHELKEIFSRVSSENRGPRGEPAVPEAPGPGDTSAGMSECSCPGFSRLRLLTGGGGPVAFAEFASAREAAAARARLQGALLLSSEGAIRLDYARHKLPHSGWIRAHEGAKGGEEGEQH